MKRILVITMLTMLLLSTVGATAAMANVKQPAGNSDVYQYDLNIDPTGSGKLVVNAKQQTFVFNGKECEPGATYTMFYTPTGGAPVSLGTGVADSYGNLHIAGPCTASPTELSLSVAVVASFQATLDVQPFNDPAWPDYWSFDITASWSGAPSTVTSVIVKITDSAGGNHGWFHTEQPLISPLDVGELGFDKSIYPTPPTLVCTLTVTDSAGHTATDVITV